MPESQPEGLTAAAVAEHMRRAALRHASDPLKRARALRTVRAALDLGIVTLDEIAGPGTVLR
jgi:predicted amidohydrolase YtcJ